MKRSEDSDGDGRQSGLSWRVVAATGVGLLFAATVALAQRGALGGAHTPHERTPVGARAAPAATASAQTLVPAAPRTPPSGSVVLIVDSESSARAARAAWTASEVWRTQHSMPLSGEASILVIPYGRSSEALTVILPVFPHINQPNVFDLRSPH